MTDLNFFSIVIPTYNRQDDLKRCLQSLANQKYKKFEVIICDNASTDDTKTIVESFKTFLDIHYILFDKNSGGPAKPRNVGIKEAKGEWICFLDSDDWFSEEKLETIANLNLNGVDLIHHQLITVDANNRKGSFYTRQINNSSPFRDLMIGLNPIQTSSVCVRRSSIIKSDLQFCEDLEIIGIEDFDLWIRMALNKFRFHLIKQNLGYYKKESTDSLSFKDERQVLRFTNLYNRHLDKLSKNDRKKSIAVLSYHKSLLYTDNRKVISYLLETIKYGTLEMKMRALYRIAHVVPKIILNNYIINKNV